MGWRMNVRKLKEMEAQGKSTNSIAIKLDMSREAIVRLLRRPDHYTFEVSTRASKVFIEDLTNDLREHGFEEAEEPKFLRFFAYP